MIDRTSICSKVKKKYFLPLCVKSICSKLHLASICKSWCEVAQMFCHLKADMYEVNFGRYTFFPMKVYNFRRTFSQGFMSLPGLWLSSYVKWFTVNTFRSKCLSEIWETVNPPKTVKISILGSKVPLRNVA